MADIPVVGIGDEGNLPAKGARPAGSPRAVTPPSTTWSQSELQRQAAITGEILQSEQRYRALVENLADVVFTLSLDGLFTFVSAQVTRVTGHIPDDLLLRSYTSLVAQDDLPRLRKALALAAGGHKVTPLNLTFRHIRGHDVLVSVTLCQLWDEGDESTLIQGVVRDLTEHHVTLEALRESEEALRRSERLLRQVIDLVPHAIFAKDSEGRFLLANNTTARHLGMSVGELTGRLQGDVHPNEDEAPSYLRDDLQIIRSGQPVTILDQPWTTPDGEARTMDVSKVPFSPSGVEGGAVLGIAMDVTARHQAESERRELEDQVRQAQKLESLGLLAGGIAHDFNNLLMTVLGNADLILESLTSDSPIREGVREIEVAAKHAADLTQQMLAYSGKGKFVVQAVDVGDVVTEMGQLLDVSIAKGIRLMYHLCSDLPLIEGDISQLRQVIMNLITNASEAIEERNGMISLTTGVRDCSSNYLKGGHMQDALRAGDYVFLEVVDTGAGMDEETLKKLFDPFFTTKFTGRGLGLAAVLGIVRGHGGTIRVQSAPGRGTTVTVLFPVPAEAPRIAPSAPAPHVEEGLWRGSGTILLVDDEPMVRSVGRRMLARLGFDVLVAEDGYEAIAHFADHIDDLVCVILDLNMPNMSGEEACGKMLDLRDDIPILIASGYCEQEVEESFPEGRTAGFIHKPYKLATLRAALARLVPNKDAT